VPFSRYCFPLLRFARENKFAYPYQDWPSSGSSEGWPENTTRAAQDLRP
jgi:hypothetical protein